MGLLKKSMWDAASNCERDWQEHLKRLGYDLGLSAKNLFRCEMHRVSGMTRGDDVVLTGPGLHILSPTKKSHQLLVNSRHKGAEQKMALGKARSGVSTRSQTC